jgi:hypothetical protein
LIIGYGAVAFIFLRRGSDSIRRAPLDQAGKGSKGIYYHAKTCENLGEHSAELELYGEPRFSSSSGKFVYDQTSSTVKARYEWN